MKQRSWARPVFTPDPALSKADDPLARTNDPEESKAGAKYAKARIGQMRQAALECVQAYPGSTCSEMAKIQAIRDPRQIGRRLNELERFGLVKRQTGCVCRITGRPAARWYPVKREQSDEQEG